MLSILALLVLVTVGANAQANHVAVGLLVSNNEAVENFEIGKNFTKNTIALVGQSYKVNSKTDRNWSAGIKYYRTFTNTTPLAFQLSGAVQMNLSGPIRDISFKPGVGVMYKITKNVALQANVATSLKENTKVFNPLNLESGIQVILSL